MTELNYTLNDLEQIARILIEKAQSKTLLFYGKMGVGKTTLIKAIVGQLGSEDVVSSPTFSLVNTYNTDQGQAFHFDFYRVEEETEALDIGVEEYFDQNAWVFVEWPEKIDSFLPQESQAIRLERREKDVNRLLF